MKVLTKPEAIEQGLKTYDGEPCKYGHDGKRFVKGDKCVQCNVERTRKFRATGKTGKTTKKAKGKAVAIIPRNELYDGGELPKWMRRDGERIVRELEAVDESYIRVTDMLAKVKAASTPRGFKKFCDALGIGRTRTYELLQIADGRKTVKEVRAADTERQRRSRENRKAVRDVTDSPEVVPVPDDTQPIIEGEAVEVTRPAVSIWDGRVIRILNWRDGLTPEEVASLITDSELDLIEKAAAFLMRLAEAVRRAASEAA